MRIFLEIVAGLLAGIVIVYPICSHIEYFCTRDYQGKEKKFDIGDISVKGT